MLMRTLDVQPQIVVLEQLLDRVARGEIRVPDFQRPFKWSPPQMLDLFESIELGYPIGTLLIWDTRMEVPTRERVGDFEVPQDRDVIGGHFQYLLDGQQRVATLLSALRREQNAPNTRDPKHWKWWIYRDMTVPPGSGTNPYRHLKGNAPSVRDLPVRCLLRTADFFDYCRVLERKVTDRREYAEIVRQAEEIAGQFKRHTTSVVRLSSDDLSQAVEVFSRTNRMGERITPDEMISALSLRHPGEMTLANRINELVDDLAQTGFETVDRTVVLRTILAVSGQDNVMSANWGSAAKSLRTTMADAVPRTASAMMLAVDFLRSGLKVPGIKFVPYSQQLLLLTYFFHRCPHPTDSQRKELVKWFWTTSWTGAFASISPGAMKRMISEMRDFADAGKPLKVDNLDRLQPMPESFNFASARTKAYVLWELNTFHTRYGTAGKKIQLESLLREESGSAFRKIVPANQSSLADSVANRIVLLTSASTRPLQALLNLDPAVRERVLHSHGITTSAWDRLVDRKYDVFIRERQEFMERKLRVFIEDLGVRADADMVGDSEPDTE